MKRFFRRISTSVLCFSFILPYTGLKADDNIKARLQMPVPDSLKMDANSVIRDYHIDFTQKDERNGEARFSRTVTVLNERGLQGASFTCMDGHFQHLKSFRATIYDATGRIVGKLKRSDLQETTYSEGLASDHHTFFHACRPRPYPFSIHYEWTCTYANGIMIYPDFYPQLTWNQSVETASYRLSLPAHVTPRYFCHHIANTPNITSSDRQRTFTWEGICLRARQPEDKPHRRLAHIYAQPTNFVCEEYEGRQDTWNNFGKWIWQLLQGRDRLPDEEVATVRELTYTASSTTEKVRRLYDYLAQHTRYVSIQLGIGGWQPISAEQVCRTKFGDCKGLTNYLRAMLKAIGIPSIYTVISTEQARIDNFPGIQQMNHVVLCVPDGADSLWLECTHARLPFGYIHSRIAGHDALLVTPEGGRMVRLPDYPDCQQIQSHHVRLAIAPDGTAQGTVHKQEHLSFYEQAMHLPRMNQQELIQQLVTGIRCTQVNVSDIQFKSHPDPLPVMNCTYNLNCQYARRGGERLFVPQNPFRQLPSTPQAQSLELDKGFVHSDTLTLKIPPGYTVERLPAPCHQSYPFGTFVSQIYVNNDILRICQYLQIYRGTYTPELRTDWTAFFDVVRRTYHEDLILKKEDFMHNLNRQ